MSERCIYRHKGFGLFVCKNCKHSWIGYGGNDSPPRRDCEGDEE
jgi:hypothetical protein